MQRSLIYNSFSFQGWQPGIQNGAVEWDDDWDMFEDEGKLYQFFLCLQCLDSNRVAFRSSQLEDKCVHRFFYGEIHMSMYLCI